MEDKNFRSKANYFWRSFSYSIYIITDSILTSYNIGILYIYRLNPKLICIKIIFVVSVSDILYINYIIDNSSIQLSYQ